MGKRKTSAMQLAAASTFLAHRIRKVVLVFFTLPVLSMHRAGEQDPHDPEDHQSAQTHDEDRHEIPPLFCKFTLSFSGAQ
jgi:hypothetical protein